MSGYYQVAGYEGNMYYRFVSEFNTIDYMDEFIASFDTEEEAKQFVLQNEDSYCDEYNRSFSYYYTDYDVEEN